MALDAPVWGGGSVRSWMERGFFEFIQHYRDWFYLISVAGTFLEGETFILFAGAACAYGLLDPIKLGLCAWLGSCLGDQCWFFLGRRFGPLVLRRWPSWKESIDAIHHRLERWDTVFILTFRFLYGVRNISAVALGLSDISARRFVVMNFVAAGLWASIFVGTGYFFGRTLGHMVGKVAETFEMTAGGLFTVGILTVIAVARWRGHRSKRRTYVSNDRSDVR